MPTPRALVLALATLLVGATSSPAQVVGASDYDFLDGSTGNGWVDPEVAWRHDDPFWEGRHQDRDDWILDWPDRRWPWPQPQPTTRGRLEAVVSGVTAQVYRERGRAAIQVDSRRVLRAAQDQVLRRDGGFRREELGREEVSFLVLIPLQEALFFTGPWRGHQRHGGSSRGGTEYLVAAVRGSKDQIYYALPVQPYDRDQGSWWQDDTGHSGTGDSYSNSIWYPGPDRHPTSSWSFDMVVVGVARRDPDRRGGVEVVMGMDFSRARENRGYIDVGELARLGRDNGGHHGSGHGHGVRRHGNHQVLGWTQDVHGRWLRRLRLTTSRQGSRSYTSDRVGGLDVAESGLNRTVTFRRDANWGGESVSAVPLVDDLRLREDGWYGDEDHGTGHGHRRGHDRYRSGTVYWGLVWQWDRGDHHYDPPIYRHQGGPDYDDLLR
jgi:hypothetical protein